MALFDFFGSKRKAEAEQKIEEQKQEQHDEAVARQREEHPEMHWPVITPINMFVKKPGEIPATQSAAGAGAGTAATGAETAAAGASAAADATAAAAGTANAGNAEHTAEAASTENAGTSAATAAQPQPTILSDPLTPERKDEVGALVYEPTLKPDMLKELNLQETLFLEAALLIAHKQHPLDNYDQNRQVIRNHFLDMVRAQEKIYVLYDARTGYPLLDGSFVLMYLDKEHAEIAAKLYAEQMRSVKIIEVPGMAAEPAQLDGKIQMKIFDYLFFLGAENIVIDNGWYKGFLRRSEISAPFYINEDPEKIPPYNPAISFALTDYVGELRWPVQYGKRKELLQAKFNSVMKLVPKGTYLLPFRNLDEDAANADGQNADGAAAEQTATPTHDGMAETTDAATESAEAAKKNHRVQLPMVTLNGKNFMPVYTDIFEFSKKFANSGFRPTRADFQTISRFMGNYDGFIINPQGQAMVIERQKNPNPGQTPAQGTGAKA